MRSEVSHGRRDRFQVGYFPLGLGIGSLIAILSAPKSGEETREYLSQNVKERNEYAQKKARELRERAEDLVKRDKEVVTQEERTNCIAARHLSQMRAKYGAHYLD